MPSRGELDQMRRAEMKANPEKYHHERRRTRELMPGIRADEVVWVADCMVGDCGFRAEADGDEHAASKQVRVHHEEAHADEPWAEPSVSFEW